MKKKRPGLIQSLVVLPVLLSATALPPDSISAARWAERLLGDNDTIKLLCPRRLNAVSALRITEDNRPRTV